MYVNLRLKCMYVNIFQEVFKIAKFVFAKYASEGKLATTLW